MLSAVIRGFNMGNTKKYLKKIILALPLGERLLAMIRIVREDKPSFDGWGLKTYHRTPPWVGAEMGIAKSFSIVNEEVVKSVQDGRFFLSQFAKFTDVLSLLRELSWRHFVIYWSVHHALRSTGTSSRKSFVECGVCDGLTIYYALRAMDELKEDQCKVYLYDSWQAMRGEQLHDSEAKNIGAYSYLSMDSTKKNLVDYASKTIFCQGFIPESFSMYDNPEEISWLHIDLNSSMATLSALEFFFPRLEIGGCIVFDDYGSDNYRETKAVVDHFFQGKRGSLLPLPTGQAIYLKT